MRLFPSCLAATLLLVLPACLRDASVEEQSTEAALLMASDASLSIDGATIPVMVSAAGPDGIGVQIGPSMGQPVNDWIESALSANYVRKSGELKAADFNSQTRSVREFKDALITEIGFPAADGASKDAAYLTLKFAPELVRWKNAGSTEGAAPSSLPGFSPSSFCFAIDGLPTGTVSKVSPVTVRSTPEGLHFADVTITFAASDRDPWQAWYDDFVIEGQNHADKEKSGSIEFLDPTGEKSLLTVTLANLGISKITPDMGTDGNDRVQATVRVGGVSFLCNVCQWQ